MNEIAFIDDAILKDASISKTKKNPASAIALLVVGIIMIVVAFAFLTNADSRFGLVFAGFISMVVGIIGAFTTKERLKYTQTDETLVRKELYFSTKDRNLVFEYVASGDVETLLTMALNNHSSLRAVIFYTASYSCVIAQVQEYVPYQYAPLTEVAFFHERKPCSIV